MRSYRLCGDAAEFGYVLGLKFLKLDKLNSFGLTISIANAKWL